MSQVRRNKSFFNFFLLASSIPPNGVASNLKNLSIEWVPVDPAERVEVVVGSLDGDRGDLVEAGLGHKLCRRGFKHFRESQLCWIIPTCQLES